MKKLVVLLPLVLSACDLSTEPRMVCTQTTGVYSCGRGGTCEQCGQWEIGCAKPLTLNQSPEGTLFCELKK